MTDRAIQLACDSALAEWTQPDAPGVALMVLRDGEPAHVATRGLADVEQSVAIEPDTRFFIASLSKQFTGACVAVAAEEGLLRVGASIREYLPELEPFADAISIEHLLRHTSGLRDVLPLLSLAGWRDADVMTHRDAFDVAAAQKSGDFAPGSSWMYSNTGYVLLAEILQRVSGQSLRAFSAMRIFEPLGMGSTHVQDDPGEPVVGRAHAYGLDRRGNLRIADLDSGLIGTTGVVSTVEDLGRWDANLCSGAVGGTGLYERITSPGRLSDGRRLGYGYGLLLGELDDCRTVEHGGWHGGWVSYFLRLPDRGLTVILCANSMTIPVSAIATAITRGILSGATAPPVATAPAPASFADGIYRDRETGWRTRIRSRDGQAFYGFGESAADVTDPMDFVAAPSRLRFEHGDSGSALLGEDRRDRIVFQDDGETICVRSHSAPLPSILERVEESEAVDLPPGDLGCFYSDELCVRLEASVVGTHLEVKARRFGPLLLEAAGSGSFATKGLTIDLEGDPCRPGALVLRSSGMRGMRFVRR